MESKFLHEILHIIVSEVQESAQTTTLNLVFLLTLHISKSLEYTLVGNKRLHMIISNLSIKAPVCQWVCLSVWMFPNFSPNGEPQRAEILRDDSPWDWEGFRLKKLRIRRTVSRKIACIVGMYTSDPSGQFYSLQYESSTYLRGW